eukprot:1409368-Pleurochrysis_carterae.AAC.1
MSTERGAKCARPASAAPPRGTPAGVTDARLRQTHAEHAVVLRRNARSVQTAQLSRVQGELHRGRQDRTLNAQIVRPFVVADAWYLDDRGEQLAR